MSEDNLTVQILIEIRDEMRATRTELKEEIAMTRTELKAEIGKTNLRLDKTNERIDQGLADVRSEIVAVEVRAATLTVEQIAATRDLYQLLTGRLDLRDRVERCEREIEALKQRAG